MNFTSINNI